MGKPVHSMIRVLDEAKALDFYARAFGLQIAERIAFPDFALVYLRHPSSPFELELTVNFDRKEPYTLGDGYGHLAVVVDDLETEHARFEKEQLAPGPLRDFKHDGKTLARFFFVADPDGYKIEVIQKGGRFGYENDMKSWVYNEDSGRDNEYIFATNVVISAREEADVGTLAANSSWALTEPEDHQRVWTDDYSNVLGAVWRRLRDGE